MNRARLNRSRRAIEQRIPEQERLDVNVVTHSMDDPIDSDLSVDKDYLNDELLSQPLLFAKWIRLSTQASKAAKLAKLDLKRVEAEVRLALSGEKLRVADVDARVELNPDVVRSHEALMEAEELAEQYHGFVRAMGQRHEVLKDLCANKRKELID